MTIRLKQVDVGEGFTDLKNKENTNQNQTLPSQKLKTIKHKIHGNHPTKKRKEEKHRVICKTRFKMAKIHIY